MDDRFSQPNRKWNNSYRQEKWKAKGVKSAAALVTPHSSPNTLSHNHRSADFSPRRLHLQRLQRDKKSGRSFPAYAFKDSVVSWNRPRTCKTGKICELVCQATHACIDLSNDCKKVCSAKRPFAHPFLCTRRHDKLRCKSKRAAPNFT